MAEFVDRLNAALAGRYAIERELGRGGMAVVFLARDRRHDRQVALKVLRPEVAASVGPGRFLREIRIAAGLAHPHILPLIDSGDADGAAFFVMPYVEGESLRARLTRERQLSVDDALRVAREVADALSYAHARGIVHRDIKPENILLEAGHAVVADFGIARAIDAAGAGSLTETGIVLGTPAYMSPEQASGSAAVDGRSDLYSLGCVLYEMLAGAPPFAGPTAQAILARQSTGRVPLVSEVRKTVPRHVEQAIAMALAAAPADRPASAEAFASALVAGPGVGADRGVSAIAVLPFSNMSADPENEYFSDGITEEVINAVATVPGMRVTARTSTFQFKGRDHDVREIGRKLDVGTVLEGSVRRAGNRIRVTAQLISVADGYHLWSERFDRDLEDVFAIQDEIALAIADRLKRGLTPDASPEPQRPAPPASRIDPEAYDAYLRGRYHRRRMFSESGAAEMASAGYREAIQKDPAFAAAHGALAELHIVTAIGFAATPGRELMTEARAAADRALALNADLAEAQLARALVAMYHDWDYAAAKTGIDRATALNPSFVDAHFWAEFYYTYVERNLEGALAANRRAAELDPLNLDISARLAQVLIIFDRIDEAVDRLRRILETDPNHMVSYVELADALGRQGDIAGAIAAAERALELSGRAVAAVGVAGAVLAVSGRADRTRALLHELTERARHGYVVPFWLALLHASVGDLDRAFELLAEARRDRDPNLLYLSVVPRAIGLHADPRYGQALREIGLGHLAPG